MKEKQSTFCCGYLYMIWFSVESVLAIKSWVSAAGLGLSLLGHIASQQWRQCWQGRPHALKVITPGTVPWFAQLCLQAVASPQQEQMSLLFLRLLHGLTLLPASTSLAMAGASVSRYSESYLDQ